MVHLHLFNHIQFQEQILRRDYWELGLYASLCSILSKSPSVVFGFVCPNLRTSGRNVVVN